MLYNRKVVITVDILKEYKELITNTISDLQDYLQDIDQRLQVLQEMRISDEDVTERERILEEKNNTRQCLTICVQVSEHVDQVLPDVFKDVFAT